MTHRRIWALGTLCMFFSVSVAGVGWAGTHKTPPNGGRSFFTDHGTLPASAAGDAGDPVLARDNLTGAFYMTTLSFNVTNQIPFFKSTDGGQTFGAPVNAIPGGVNLDKDWMAVDNFAGAGQHNIYVCATDFGFSPARIVVTHSTDGGVTFGPSGGVALSNTGQSQGCSVAVGPDHSVYVAYFRGNSPDALFIRRSTDGGVTFGPEHQITTLNNTQVNGDLGLNGGFRSNSFPSLAVDPTNGELFVAFNDHPTTSGDNADVFYSQSVDDGATWSPPVRINDYRSRDQFSPTVATTPDGKNIMFGYYDRSQDPSNLVFHRQGRAGTINTTTGAVGLRHSFQLGPNTPPVHGQDPVINSVYMGDYDQIDATNSFFQTTWADNRNGDSFHTNQPDVRNALITTAPPNSDIGVTVTPTPASIDQGSDTNVKVDVTATGGLASDVFVNLSPVVGLEYQSAPPGCDVVNGFVGCLLQNIPGGLHKSFSVVATGVSVGTRTVKATATTSSRETNLANNTGSANVTVNSVPSTTSSFTTGNIAVPIPDNTTVDVPLSVPDVGNVLKVVPRVRLNHTFDSDLVISLIDPSSNTVLLANRRGTSGDNYGSGTNDCSAASTPTTFNDSSATPIGAGTAPFAGVFKPEQPLASLNGDPSGGPWTLRAQDTATSDTGTIGCFKLNITHP